VLEGAFMSSRALREGWLCVGSWLLFASVGCGAVREASGTDAGRSTGGDDQGPGGNAGAGGASAGGDLSFGGAGGRGAGGIASHTGGAFSAGGAATGGGGPGPACLGSDNMVRRELKYCNHDEDCSEVLIGSCCSGNLIAGVTRGKTCTPPDLQGCSQLGCPGSTNDSAEDGNTSTTGTIVVTCASVGDGGSGECRTQVAPQFSRIPCGTAICGLGMACLHPPTSVGGPAPICVEPLDGGACPAGTAMQSFCNGRAGGGCVAVYTPPPPSCIPVPPACAEGVTCACFSPSVCGGGANVCNGVSGRDVTCVNLAP
jgi:hypothetical protein